MFNANKREDFGLQKEIDALLEAMSSIDRGSVDYAKMVDQLVKLYSLKEDNSKTRISADTLAIVGGNLAGILTIVLAEKSSVITSVAKGFILKSR